MLRFDYNSNKWGYLYFVYSAANHLNYLWIIPHEYLIDRVKTKTKDFIIITPTIIIISGYEFQANSVYIIKSLGLLFKLDAISFDFVELDRSQ